MVSNCEEGRLSYLLSGSCEVLPSSYVKLRSYLNIHSSNVAELQNFNIFKSRKTCCPYCYSSWTCDTSSFKLLPSKKSKARSKKRDNVEPDQKQAANESRNVLVLKCKVCTRKSYFSLVKKHGVKRKVQKEEENVKSANKKKKKKDKSCGLLINVGKIVTPSLKPFTLKKKTGLTSVEKDQLEILPQKNSQKFQPKSSLSLSSNPNCRPNPFTQTGKRLVVNPLAPQAQSKFKKRKKQQKLKELKNAVKGGKDVAKKTLKDFLTLI